MSREVFDATVMYFDDKVKWIEEGAMGYVLIIAEKQQQ